MIQAPKLSVLKYLTTKPTTTKIINAVNIW